MARSVFISYSWQQKDWVWDRLLPCLRAVGADVLIDREQFEPGKPVKRLERTTQAKAELDVLVLSPDYLASENCQSEMRRAIRFKKENVIPIVRVTCDLPTAITRPELLRVDLREDRDASAWKALLDRCGDDLGVPAPEWLRARDEIRRHLSRRESVNLLVQGNVRWRPLLDHVSQENSYLGVVDLDDPATFSLPGLVRSVLDTCGISTGVPGVPDDLGRLHRVLSERKRTRVALLHFDRVARRLSSYGDDLFVALRYMVMESKTLDLLIQSRTPFAALVPRDVPLSQIDLKTVELRGRT